MFTSLFNPAQPRYFKPWVGSAEKNQDHNESLIYRTGSFSDDKIQIRRSFRKRILYHNQSFVCILIRKSVTILVRDAILIKQ